MKKSEKRSQEKVKLTDFEIFYIRNYLKDNNLTTLVDEDILDDFIMEAGKQDGLIGLHEEEPDLKIDIEYIENMSLAASQIVNKWENQDLDFEDLNKRLGL